MALYRAMAVVIFGSLAIAVSSATRLWGCCARAGLWDPAQKFAGPKGRTGLTTRDAPNGVTLTAASRGWQIWRSNLVAKKADPTFPACLEQC